jgi:hypothetical protein
MIVNYHTIMSMLKVSEAFKIYLECKNNGTLVQNMISIFERMTQYILNSRTIDSNFDLLMQLSLINTEGDISQSPIDYQNLKLFKSFFKTYSQYIHVQGKSEIVIKHILEAVTPLIPYAKIAIFNFIWALPGFRKGLAHYVSVHDDGTVYNGADYTKHSIISPMLSTHKKEYTSNKVSSKAFKSLTEEMGEDEFNSVFGYFMKIIRANIAYTYDNVMNYQPQLSSYELLGTVLILMVGLIKNNKIHVFESSYTILQSRLEDVWNMINILYFTLFEIKRSTADTYAYNNEEFIRLVEQFGRTGDASLTSIIKGLRSKVDEGVQGLERVTTIIKDIDNKFVESVIFSNTQHLLDTMNTSAIFRLRKYLLERKVKPNTALSRNICYFVIQILESRIPVQLKSEFLRYIMAYSLSTEFVELGQPLGTDNNKHMDVVANYLLTDARKLGDFKLIHSFDVLEHFSRHLYLFGSQRDPHYKRCVKIIRLYLGYLEEGTEFYKLIISAFLNVPDHTKPNIIKDMMTVIGYCKDLIMMVGLIGQEALEYIDSLLLLIEQIVDTKTLINIPSTIDPLEIAVIDQIKPTCIKNFKPLVLEMFRSLNEKVVFYGGDDLGGVTDEWRIIYSMYYVKSDLAFSESVFRLVLKTDTIERLDKIFNINLNDMDIFYLLIGSDNSDSNIDSKYLDAITCDLIVAPVAIQIAIDNDEVMIINQRTMHKILLDGVNPYTRQPLTYDDVIQINSKPSVREKMDEIIDFTRRLTR